MTSSPFREELMSLDVRRVLAGGLALSLTLTLAVAAFVVLEPILVVRRPGPIDLDADRERMD